MCIRDRLRIVAARRALEAGERLAAVGGLVARGVDGVDNIRVLRVDVNAAVVAALAVSNSLIVGGHLVPRGAGVVGTVEAPVADDEHALGVGVHPVSYTH